MRASKTTYIGVSAGAYPWIPMDHHIEESNFTVFVHEQGSGNITVKIQGTLDNLSTESSARAFDLVSGIAGSAGHWQSWSGVPLAALRLSVAVSGSANATFTVMQAGN